MFIDTNGKKTYKPARNDDRLNSHIPSILSIWCGNVDCQPVLDIHAVQKYIAKYAAKSETKSESFHQMLRRIVHAAPLLDPSIVAVQKFLSETLVDRDIGAQETCHMLQKLPLTVSSRTFLSLNVNRKTYKRVSSENRTSFTSPNFIAAYLHITKLYIIRI